MVKCNTIQFGFYGFMDRLFYVIQGEIDLGNHMQKVVCGIGEAALREKETSRKFRLSQSRRIGDPRRCTQTTCTT